LLRQPPGRAWGLPAGLLKRDEDPAAGAARELHEESGVRLDPEQLEPAVPNAVVHLKGWVDMVYRASVPASSTTLAVDGGEVLEAGWFPLDDLPRLTVPTAVLLGIYGMGPRAGQTPPGGTHPAGPPPAGPPPAGPAPGGDTGADRP
jgi:ADP-ribose pyrophosphatase YjhB (NUDIX family)